MKYIIGVDIIFKDRTETKCVEGEDVNDVHNRVVDIQFQNLPYYKQDEKTRRNLKKELIKNTNEIINRLVEKKVNFLKNPWINQSMTLGNI